METRETLSSTFRILITKVFVRAMSRYKLEINKKKDIANLITDTMHYLTAKKKQASLLLKYCQSRLEALKRVEHPFLAPITKEERKIARNLMELNQIQRV